MRPLTMLALVGTEQFMERAAQEAEQLVSSHPVRNQRECLPLFGLPISIKDGVGIKGIDCSNGIAG